MPNTSPGKKVRKFGDFELLEKVGHGGMSAVYKARDTRSDSIVAVKVASRAVINDPILSRRFELEYAVAHPLQHRNLVRVIDFGKHQNLPYLVMEYIDGLSLSQRLNAQETLSEHETLGVILPIADALTFLHEKQMVHRDVKPANILVPKSGETKLADLGLIKDLESLSRLTRSNLGLGTMQFASPEQFESAHTADTRSDIYSLAATMYTALTGEYPFGRGSLLAVLERKIANQFEAPICKVPHLRPAVDAVIRMGLNADRDRRPASVREFAAYLTGEKALPLDLDLPGTLTLAAPSPKIAKPAPADRRVCPRYPVDLPASCRAIAAGRRWSATIMDMSTTGLCLLVNRRFEMDSLLEISFKPRSGFSPVNQLARVRWVKSIDSESFMLGCEFGSPISDDDLDTIFADYMESTNQLAKR